MQLIVKANPEGSCSLLHPTELNSLNVILRRFKSLQGVLTLVKHNPYKHTHYFEYPGHSCFVTIAHHVTRAYHLHYYAKKLKERAALDPKAFKAIEDLVDQGNYISLTRLAPDWDCTYHLQTKDGVNYHLFDTDNGTDLPETKTESRLIADQPSPREAAIMALEENRQTMPDNLFKALRKLSIHELQQLQRWMNL